MSAATDDNESRENSKRARLDERPATFSSFASVVDAADAGADNGDMTRGGGGGGGGKEKRRIGKRVDGEASAGCCVLRMPVSLRAHCLGHLDLAALYGLHRVSRRYTAAIERHLAYADAIHLKVRAVRKPPVAPSVVPDDVEDFLALRLAARCCARLARLDVDLGPDEKWSQRPLRLHLETAVVDCFARNLPTLRTARIVGLCDTGCKAVIGVAGDGRGARLRDLDVQYREITRPDAATLGDTNRYYCNLWRACPQLDVLRDLDAAEWCTTDSAEVALNDVARRNRWRAMFVADAATPALAWLASHAASLREIDLSWHAHGGRYTEHLDVCRALGAQWPQLAALEKITLSNERVAPPDGDVAPRPVDYDAEIDAIEWRFAASVTSLRLDSATHLRYPRLHTPGLRRYVAEGASWPQVASILGGSPALETLVVRGIHCMAHGEPDQQRRRAAHTYFGGDHVVAALENPLYRRSSLSSSPSAFSHSSPFSRATAADAAVVAPSDVGRYVSRPALRVVELVQKVDTRGACLDCRMSTGCLEALGASCAVLDQLVTDAECDAASIVRFLRRACAARSSDPATTSVETRQDARRPRPFYRFQFGGGSSLPSVLGTNSIERPSHSLLEAHVPIDEICGSGRDADSGLGAALPTRPSLDGDAAVVTMAASVPVAAADNALELRCMAPSDGARFGAAVGAWSGALRALTLSPMTTETEVRVPMRGADERGCESLRRLRLASSFRDVRRQLSWFPRLERLELHKCGLLALASLAGAAPHLQSLRHLACSNRGMGSVFDSYAGRVAALIPLLPRLTHIVVTTLVPNAGHAEVAAQAIARLVRTAAAVSFAACRGTASSAADNQTSVSSSPGSPPSGISSSLTPSSSSSSCARQLLTRTEPIDVVWRQLAPREFVVAHRPPLGVTD